MSRSFLLLSVVVLTLAPGCARRSALRGYEPADPTGDDLRAQEGDVLAKLLEQTVLHYGFDDATLSSGDLKRLQKLGVALSARPWANIRIAGHCDERGTEEYNLALGQRRAEAARSYLLALGVPHDQVDSVSFGAEVPLNAAGDEDAWAENRRSEFGAAPLELFGLLDTEVR